MFIDEVIVKCRAGRGGDGAVSWRREKCMPNGGPYGGDGGKGGDLILRATTNQNTLIDFRHKKVLKGNNGERGATKEMTGAGGENTYILLPVGTIVTEAETGEKIVDLNHDGDEFILCRWGKGGFGNAHFCSSTRQAPNFAELGDEGEEISVKLELKLVADVGLIGLPNAGKSTLISAITKVRPKIAAYPFTTIIPNLGVMEYKGRGLFIEDVPGLIEGASEGKGLGIQFLKHIERTAVLCHLLDLSQTDEEIMDNYRVIRAELAKHSDTLELKPEIVVLSKLDLVPPDEQESRIKKLKKKFPKSDVLALSAGAFIGIPEFQDFLIKKIPAGQREMAAQIADEPTDGVKVYDLKSYHNPKTIHIRRRDRDTFDVTGERIEQLARMTNMNNREGIARMHDILDREGVISRVRAMLKIDAEAHRATYFEGTPDDDLDPKIVIAERVFRLGDVTFL